MAAERTASHMLAETKNRLFRACATTARLDPKLAHFSTRGFSSNDTDRQRHLEAIGETFVFGFNTALSEEDPTAMRAGLDSIPKLNRGFAYEGAAMGTAVADALPFSGEDRLQALLSDVCSDYIYLAHVGVGWAMARLPWRRRKLFAMLDPLLCWLSWDGAGFQDIYFSPRRLKRRGRRNGYANRAWDQGAGRALWFVSGGDCDKAIRLIQSQDDDRHGDLYAGLGLALTYIGGASDGELEWVREQSGTLAPHLAQGAAFAAEARARANNLTQDTDNTCRIFCRCSANDAAALARSTSEDLTSKTIGTDELPAYEIWRTRLMSVFSETKQERQPACLAS